MKEKWLLVLGANSDIAVATAHRFAREGWNIYLASRNKEKISQEAANLYIRFGVKVAELKFDALNFESHSAFYENLDPKPFGIIVAFGILGDQGEAQINFPEARAIIESNYVGAVSILEVAAQNFEERQYGFIACISSVAGDRGRASNYIYGSSKAGLSAYISGLRHRLFKNNVQVLTVKPGFVKTKMTQGMNFSPMLLAQPEQVANDIYRGILGKKNIIYVRKKWRLIMLIINHLPEFVFKRTKL